VFGNGRGAWLKRQLANAVIGPVQDELDKSYLGLLTLAETCEAFHALDFARSLSPSCTVFARHTILSLHCRSMAPSSRRARRAWAEPRARHRDESRHSEGSN